MDSMIAFLAAAVLLLLAVGVLLFALFYVVRTAVSEGVQIALRSDLLDQRRLGGTDAR